MNGGMKKIYVTAIAAVLLLSGLVFLTNLSGQGKADNVSIQGMVTKCVNGVPVASVSGAKVTLAQVHTMAVLTYNTPPAGTFVFNDRPAGMYKVKVEKSGYFTNETSVFRFNGTKKMDLPLICLEKMPVKDLTLEGTIGTNPIPVTNEAISFQRNPMPNHRVNDNWGQNTTSWLFFVTLPNTPLVNGSISVWWENQLPSGLQQEFIDWQVVDLWNGIIEIMNSTINQNLSGNGPYGALRMKYDYSETTASFANSPVAYNSVVVSKNGSPWTSTDDYEVNYGAGTITVLGNFTFGVDSMTVNYTYYTPVLNAKLVLLNKTHDQIVEEVPTDTGTFSFGAWAGSYELSCESEEYEKYVDPNLVITDSLKLTILLDASEPVVGWAKDSDGTLEDDNVRAYLFSYDTGLPLSKRVIPANVSTSLFEFDAYPDTFLLIVDADGYKASATQVTVPVASGLFIELEESDEERYSTEITFDGDDWNNLIVYRNITLNNDSRIFGMDYDDIRNAQLQIDLALGNADGTLSNPEFFTTFKNWLVSRGPEYVTYEDFMTINSQDYMSWFDLSNPSDTEYYVNVDRVSEKIYINTTTYYTTNFTNFTEGSIGSGEVELDQDAYFLNITMKKDTSTDVTRNYTYLVRLPKDSSGNFYELNLGGSRVTPGVKVDSFIDVSVDPSDLEDQPSVDLRIERSLNGTARAKVFKPEGKFYVLNHSFDNYLAIVKSATNITFTAADSTDPNQRTLEGANFTWYFKWLTAGAFNPANRGYGMEPVFNYTTPGNYTVRLNLTEAGGNVTYRNINISVDGTLPTARINVDDHTLVTSGTHRILYVNQSKTIKLNGSASTDIVWGNVPGQIDKWWWYWEYLKDKSNESELGKIWELSFGNPGRYNVTLNVTDVVGHTSPTVNITVIVKDIEKPQPSFKKLENGTWKIVETLIENKLYWFDASSTTDNYDDTKNLTFNWTFPGSNYRNGMNVSYTFTDTGTFNVTLNATDRAGNYAASTQSVIVSPNSSARPDLKVIDGSFVASPGDPEEGWSVTLSVNISNRKDRAVANNVVVNFTAIIGDDVIPIEGTVTFYDSNGTQISQSTATIKPNETVTAKITWVPSKMGNFTIRINATATNEHAGTMLDNSISAYVNVREAGWKKILIYVLIIVVPIVIFLLIYLRRKYKRGELFKKREEEEEEERPRGRRRARGKEEEPKKRRFFGRGKEEVEEEEE